MPRIENGNDGVDIPAAYTSSIGAVIWPPEAASYERLKGIYGEVIETSNQLSNFLDNFSNLPFNSATRISARVIVTMEALRNLPKELTDLIHFIETIIPLEQCGIEELSDCLLIYIGKNTPQRQPPPKILESQLQKAEKIFSQPASPSKPIPTDFSIRQISLEQRINPQIREMYYQLYKLFGWSEEEIDQMLINPNNLIFAAADSERTIVCSALAEKGIINFKRNNQIIPLYLVEITEAATLPKFRGKGLYQAVSNEILKFLAQSSPPPNLVFGELNLDAAGVLKVAAKQRRIPAFHTAEQFGIPHAWCLNQHVIISKGDNSSRPANYPYNNLMVAYLPRELLLENYGK